jgi:hypothetical protein
MERTQALLKNAVISCSQALQVKYLNNALVLRTDLTDFGWFPVPYEAGNTKISLPASQKKFNNQVGHTELILDATNIFVVKKVSLRSPGTYFTQAPSKIDTDSERKETASTTNAKNF